MICLVMLSLILCEWVVLIVDVMLLIVIVMLCLLIWYMVSVFVIVGFRLNFSLVLSMWLYFGVSGVVMFDVMFGLNEWFMFV